MTPPPSAEAMEVAKKLADKLMWDARLRQNSPVDTIAAALDEFAEETAKRKRRCNCEECQIAAKIREGAHE